MTWRWVIFFSLAFTLAGAAWPATVSGKVDLTDSKLVREKDDSGVVVWLEPLAGTAPAGTPVTPAETAVMAHKKKTFVPHVLAIRTGSKVSFPNLDPFFHNAFSNYDGQIFDIGLHPPGSAREVTFRRPGIVRLFCNIHPTMSAVIVVLDTPYFAVSDAQGEFRIAMPPPGDYRLKCFHERALANVLRSLERPITVGPDDLALPTIAISEAGYLVLPHKNKYGKDYPAIVVDQYPGPGRKP